MTDALPTTSRTNRRKLRLKEHPSPDFHDLDMRTGSITSDSPPVLKHSSQQTSPMLSPPSMSGPEEVQDPPTLSLSPSLKETRAAKSIPLFPLHNLPQAHRIACQRIQAFVTSQSYVDHPSADERNFKVATKKQKFPRPTNQKRYDSVQIYLQRYAPNMLPQGLGTKRPMTTLSDGKLIHTPDRINPRLDFKSQQEDFCPREDGSREMLNAYVVALTKTALPSPPITRLERKNLTLQHVTKQVTKQLVKIKTRDMATQTVNFGPLLGADGCLKPRESLTHIWDKRGIMLPLVRDLREQTTQSPSQTTADQALIPLEAPLMTQSIRIQEASATIFRLALDLAGLPGIQTLTAHLERAWARTFCDLICAMGIPPIPAWLPPRRNKTKTFDNWQLREKRIENWILQILPNDSRVQLFIGLARFWRLHRTVYREFLFRSQKCFTTNEMRLTRPQQLLSSKAFLRSKAEYEKNKRRLERNHQKHLRELEENLYNNFQFPSQDEKHRTTDSDAPEIYTTLDLLQQCF